MEEATGIRRLLAPEVILLVFGLLLAFGVIWRTSTGECHAWKDKLGRISGAYLAAAGEQEYPQPGTRTVIPNREGLRRATSRLLDERPFGCF